ncbi:MAG TPA: prephenate dehydratase [Terriglobales bacterium]|nr:prephenate dehydratase [Terriglobales bacterium]
MALRVAIQGELGSFSHAAAGQMLPGCSVVPCAVSLDVFNALRARRVDAAVIPIENTLAGPVSEHYDLLLERPVFIQREFRLRIEHNLLAAPGVKLAGVRRVLSHPVALAQCRDFFKRHRNIEPVPFYDTAGSVKHVMARQLSDTAAIAGRAAAREYGARFLLRGIEDDKQNFTRFYLVLRAGRPLPRANKTSIAFFLKNQPGALYRALSGFASRGISLSKIESRPVRGRPWEYVFFADFLRGDDRESRAALRDLARAAQRVKLLGVYPEAK